MDFYDECLDISNKIINKYIELLLSYGNDDLDSRKIDSILELVLKEYDIIYNLNNKDLNKYIKLVNLSDNEVLYRIKNKLIDYKEVLNGIYITGFELGLNKINGYMRFSIYDTIISMINIDTIKSLYNKIYSLNSNCLSDDKFIERLKYRLDISKIQLLFNSNVSEILALYYNISVNDIPRIDRLSIKNKINQLNNKKYNSLIENTVIIFITKIMQELAKIKYIKNNDREVFKYLVYITQIEILIDYLDKNKLQELYNFCIKIRNNENSSIMNYVKRIVKKKIND